MEDSPLPMFGGKLHDSWELHEIRLLSWLRTHAIREDDDDSRTDFLMLSLHPTPLNWFVVQPPELRSSFVHSLNLLKNKYGNDLRKEMLRLSALNSLEVRSFRDNEHKTEMVFELVNELDQLLGLSKINHDAQRREYLLRCFRGFSGALKMMNRATSYDGAILAALTWESSVISKAEEAMMQAAIKRQLAQKPQTAHSPPSKRKSQPSTAAQPTHVPEPQTNTDYPANFMPQNFQSNPIPVYPPATSYYKSHLPSSQQQAPSHNEKLPTQHPQQLDSRQDVPMPQPQYEPLLAEGRTDGRQMGFHTPKVAPDAPLTTRDDSDTGNMMESLVDPDLAPGQSPSRPQQAGRMASHGHLMGMDQNSEEVLHSPLPDPHLAKQESEKYKVKPLVYNPEKNPYPPPEHLPENQSRNQTILQEPSTSNFNRPMQPSRKPWQNQSSSDVQGINGLNPRHTQIQASGSNSVYPPQTATIPFPSPKMAPQPLQNGSPPPPFPKPQIPMGRQQSMPVLPGSSSSQPGTQFFESTTNFESAGSSSVQYPATTAPNGLPMAQPKGHQQVLPRRPSKLVKLRRPGSSSSNSSVSQRSTGSLGRIRNFLGSLHQRSSRGSQSYDESDSTQDRGPNTPSSLGPSPGGSCFDSEGNERLRPMQAQFNRLFRKHNHPEALRRRQRSVVINSSLPASQQPIKGKGRSLHFGSSRPDRAAPSPPNTRIMGMGHNDELFSGQGQQGPSNLGMGPNNPSQSLDSHDRSNDVQYHPGGRADQIKGISPKKSRWKIPTV